MGWGGLKFPQITASSMGLFLEGGGFGTRATEKLTPELNVEVHGNTTRRQGALWARPSVTSWVGRWVGLGGTVSGT